MARLHIKDRVRSALGIREGEGPSASAFFAYLLLVIACYVIAKAVRDALFISRFGAFKLPYMYIGIAALAGVFVSVYIRLARRIRHDRLISGTLLFFAANLAVFWWLLQFQFDWLYPAIYFWSGIFGVIAPMQVWTLSNFVYTTRQAKRLYGFIGAGGILGAITGGFFSSQMVGQVGTDNLLLAIIAFIAVCAVLVQVIWRQGGRTQASEEVDPGEQPRSLRESLALILRSRYLALIAIVIALSQIVSTAVDFQFKAVTEQVYQSKDALTGFFGAFYGYLGIFSFILQMFVTSRLLRKLGVGVALFILPVAVAGGSLALLVWTTLAAALTAKGPDQLLKHSVDKSATEMLYLPVSADVKPAVKSFIDTVLWRIADAAAGGLALLLTAVFGFGVRGVTAVTLALIAGWLVALVLIRRQYADALRAAIAGQKLSVEARPRINVSEPDTAETFIRGLHSRNTDDVLLALETIRAAKAGPALLPHLEPLLAHHAAAVRAAALDVLAQTGDRRVAEKVVPLFDDESPHVRAKALHLARRLGKRVPENRILHFLRETNYRLRGAAIVWALDRQAKLRHHALASNALESLLRSPNERARREAARALGALRTTSAMQQALGELLQDPSGAVVEQALQSAGALARPELVPLIVPHLKHRSTRVAACRALAEYGPAILSQMREYLLDEEQDVAIRAGVMRVIRTIGNAEAARILVEALDRTGPELRLKIIQALSDVRTRHPELELPAEAIRGHLADELRDYYRTFAYLSAVYPPAEGDEPQRAPSLLVEALQRRLELLLESIFRLLSLLYPPEDLLRIHRGICSKDAGVRANAVELLETLLPQEMKDLILPVLDDEVGVAARLERGMRLGVEPPRDRSAALAQLLRSRVPLVAVAAMDEVYEQRIEELYPEMEALAGHPDAQVAQAAGSLRQRVSRRPGEKRIA